MFVIAYRAGRDAFSSPALMLMKNWKLQAHTLQLPSANKELITIAPPFGTPEKDGKTLSTLKKKKFTRITGIAFRKRRFNEQSLLCARKFCSFYCICIVKATNLSPHFITNIKISTKSAGQLIWLRSNIVYISVRQLYLGLLMA